MNLKLIVAAVLLNVSAYAQDYNIKQFGAVSDTTRLSTIAINKAISACYKNGGGRVVIPSGKYKSGTITLKSNVELHLERGAILYASTRHQDLPRQKQPVYRSQKDPGGWFALIYAEGASNIGISGPGTIDGQGGLQKPRPELVQGGDLDGRPRNILFISCKDVSVKEVSMRNAGIWNQHYLDCEDVTVDHINVYNHANRNNDGIDIDGCRRFVLSNSIIDSDDDAIVLKSTGAAGCSDVTITNCITSSFTNAIKCGTESTGGFKNIVISNCIVKPSKSKVPPIFGRTSIGISGISLEIVDGGTMEGVTVSNIMIEKTECPIFVRLGNRARKHMAGVPTPAPGIMKDIHFSNITAYNAGNYTSSITGVPEAHIENITLDNIHLSNAGGLKAGGFLATAAAVKEDEKGYPEPTVWQNLPASGLFIRHAGKVVLTNIDISSKQDDPRPALIGADIDQLTIRDLRFQGPVNDRVQLQDVRTATIPDGIKTEIKRSLTDGAAVKGLKDYFKDYFPIGVAVAPRNLTGKDSALIVAQFNSLTPENAFKFGPIHPEENRYNWAGADSIISFAKRNHLKVRGHTFCWHEQTPGWLFIDNKGKEVTKDVLLKRLKTHINAVMGRYKGQVYAWDVVNEAIDDDSTKFLRNSRWFKICGEDYIIRAFEYAHQADPKAILFYNDYNTEHPERRERIYKLLKKLKDAGVPVHAIGLQAHWNLEDPSQKELIATIKRFSSLGLKVQITELDISVLPEKKKRDSAWLAAPDVYTPLLEKRQIAQYTSVFKVFRQYKDILSGVTFWNIADKYTWLDQTPSAKGKKNYPLLFDFDLKPKKVFFKVVDF